MAKPKPHEPMPGPWFYHGDSIYAVEDHTRIATLAKYRCTHDAHTMACAPELLEALIGARRQLAYLKMSDEALKPIDDLILKVKGGYRGRY